MSSSIHERKARIWRTALMAVLVLGSLTGCSVLGLHVGGDVLAKNLAVSMNDATEANLDLNVGTGNLTIGSLAVGDSQLATGELEYYKGDEPAYAVEKNGGIYDVSVQANGGRKAGFQLPWANQNGESDWNLSVNPGLPVNIRAHSGGGNLVLNLAGLALTGLNVDTSGGNISIELGSGISGFSSIIASSGAGNVEVRLPDGTAAQIHASSGMGKLMIDPQFVQIDNLTFQSSGYAEAANKIEITLKSGMGNVSVSVIAG